jgi:hypothetical protein
MAWMSTIGRGEQKAVENEAESINTTTLPSTSVWRKNSAHE